MGSINGSTPAMTWTFLSGSVTAPPTAVNMEVSPELFSGSTGNVVYYDDISVTTVPEPSAALALLLGLGVLRLTPRKLSSVDSQRLTKIRRRNSLNKSCHRPRKLTHLFT
jgi:hypothetical protein